MLERYACLFVVLVDFFRNSLPKGYQNRFKFILPTKFQFLLGKNRQWFMKYTKREVLTRNCIISLVFGMRLQNNVFSGEDYGPFVGGFQSLRLLYFQLKMQMTHCCLSQCSQSWWSSLQWKQSSLGIACASSLFFFFMDEVVHCFIHHLPLQFFFSDGCKRICQNIFSIKWEGTEMLEKVA